MVDSSTKPFMALHHATVAMEPVPMLPALSVCAHRMPSWLIHTALSLYASRNRPDTTPLTRPHEPCTQGNAYKRK